jgi:Flp pilus assembly protein TadD
MILALDAGLRGDPAGALSQYTELVRLYPNDERSQNLLGNLYFGRQDYDKAVTHFVKATTINPSFSQPYNQLGYAYRTLERFDDAESTFKKYTLFSMLSRPQERIEGRRWPTSYILIMLVSNTIRG